MNNYKFLPAKKAVKLLEAYHADIEVKAFNEAVIAAARYTNWMLYPVKYAQHVPFLLDALPKEGYTVSQHTDHVLKVEWKLNP